MKTASYVYGVEPVDGNDAWALFVASAAGDLAGATALLRKDPRLVNAQYWYRFPIHLAVFAGSAPVVELLLEHGADTGQSIYTFDSWDKLLRAADERGERKIKALLARALRKRFRYDPEFDALKEAIIARDGRRISAVLKQRPGLARAADALGNNPLHWSVITRQLELLRRFVELGTPIDARRADGLTPVLLAAGGASDYWYRETRGRSHPSLRNTSVLVGSLLALGAEYTLSVAAAVGDQERVEQLLKSDPKLAARLDSARASPLSHAAAAGHLHIVRLLLEHGADPNLPEDAAPRGRALYAACCANHVPIAQLLLDHGADPNAGVDSSECCLTIGSVFHGAAAKPLEGLLRERGATMPPYRMNAAELKRAIRDKQPATGHDEFFDCVMRTGDDGLLELYLDSMSAAARTAALNEGVPSPETAAQLGTLLARGLDPNRPDWLGRTLLHECAASGDRTLAGILLDAGADINAREVEFRGTPLAAAVRAACGETDAKTITRQRRMVEFLLKRGAATNLAGDAPWSTPLACAKRHGLDELAELLQDRSPIARIGADRKGERGRQPPER